MYKHQPSIAPRLPHSALFWAFATLTTRPIPTFNFFSTCAKNGPSPKAQSRKTSDTAGHNGPDGSSARRKRTKAPPLRRSSRSVDELLRGKTTTKSTTNFTRGIDVRPNSKGARQEIRPHARRRTLRSDNDIKKVHIYVDKSASSRGRGGGRNSVFCTWGPIREGSLSGYLSFLKNFPDLYLFAQVRVGR